jgi:hypothetical protein
LPLRPAYVLQRRRGVFFPYDEWIDRNGRPMHRISRQGVDLLRVFPYAETLRAYQAAKDLPVPEYLRRGSALHSIWPEAKELREPAAPVP